VKRVFNRYRIHLFIGLFFFPFLLISALTGFFRANHKWFWKEDYKKVKNFTYNHALEKPVVSVDSIFGISKAKLGEQAVLTEIRLRKEIGRLFYDIRSKGNSPLLIDAATGQIVSPLTPELAIALASQYVQAGAEVKKVYADDHYKTRKEKKPRPVYVIEYADELNTQILLDKQNGEIEEEIDANLKFGFWMVKLHDYDFWNSKRVILSIAGIGLTVVGLSGFYLWLRKKDKKIKKVNKKRRSSEHESIQPKTL
jgi:uncharacterized iron-regulated membrane protein